MNQAAWKCESCRASGLERSRRCGFLPESERGPVHTVWARRRSGATECPRSLITAESLYLLERYYVIRRYGGGDMLQLPARVMDAYLLLEQEQTEEEHERERNRP